MVYLIYQDADAYARRMPEGGRSLSVEQLATFKAALLQQFGRDSVECFYDEPTGWLVVIDLHHKKPQSVFTKEVSRQVFLNL